MFRHKNQYTAMFEHNSEKHKSDLMMPRLFQMNFTEEDICRQVILSDASRLPVHHKIII